MAARKRLTQAPSGRSGSGGWLFRPILGAISALTYYTFAVRPWLLRWGATAEEASTLLPGDDLVPEAQVCDHPSGNRLGFRGIDLAMARSVGPRARGLLHVRSA